MPKFELTKSIECKRLNKRSKLPFAEHPAIIPYGALVDEIEDIGGAGRFVYLGELYECSHGLLQSALASPNRRLWPGLPDLRLPPCPLWPRKSNGKR